MRLDGHWTALADREIKWSSLTGQDFRFEVDRSFTGGFASMSAASAPLCFVPMSQNCSTLVTKIFPSPEAPVVALLRIVLTTLLTWSSLEIIDRKSTRLNSSHL